VAQDESPSSDTPIGDAAVPKTEAGGRLSPLFRPFAALSHREFRLLWLGQLCQASAMWAEQVARNWLTLEITGSALQLGAVNLVRIAPTLALGMWGGVLADRFDRRKLLMIIQTWSLLVYIAMSWVILTGNLELWHLYASAMALSLTMAVNQPVRTAMVPAMVPPHHLLAALSLTSVAINATRLVGPALVGLLIVVASAGWAYVAAGFSFVLILIFTGMIHLPPLPVRERTTSMLAELWEGFVFLRRNRLVLTLVVIGFGPLAVGFSYQVLVPVFVVRTLEMGAGTYGLLVSIAGVGALFSGLTIAAKGSIPRQGLMMVLTGSSYGAALLLLGGVHWLLLAMPLFLILGGSQTVFRAANNSILLNNTPNHLRGRVMSMSYLHTGISPVVMLAAGALADAVSVSIAFAAIGAGCLLVVWTVALWEPRTRKL
jgi:MFS family permease